MKVEFFVDDEHKKDTKLIVNDKNISLKKCQTITIKIDARFDYDISISTIGGTAEDEIKQAIIEPIIKGGLINSNG